MIGQTKARNHISKTTRSSREPGILAQKLMSSLRLEGAARGALPPT